MSKPKAYIDYVLPRKEHFAVGPCPCCGRLDTWLNDVPLRAFCWGGNGKIHREWAKRIPAKFNRYSHLYDKDAVPKPIKYKDLRKEVS